MQGLNARLDFMGVSSGKPFQQDTFDKTLFQRRSTVQVKSQKRLYQSEQSPWYDQDNVESAARHSSINQSVLGKKQGCTDIDIFYTGDGVQKHNRLSITILMFCFLFSAGFNIISNMS